MSYYVCAFEQSPDRIKNLFGLLPDSMGVVSWLEKTEIEETSPFHFLRAM